MATRMALRSLLAALVLTAGLGVGGASAAHADIGFPGASFGALETSPTGSKPQSKLWFNGGWWATMFDAASGEHRIHRLDRGAQVWQDTGVTIDDRDDALADVLWDAAAGKLYVASHRFTTPPGAATGPGRLWRFSYDATSASHTVDPGFPVDVNAVGTETLVIAKDSTGTLWATWMAGGQIHVNHTIGGDDALWATPSALPVAGAAVDVDDIASVVAFGGDRIGIMWSNQLDERFHFAVHVDGAAPEAWSATAIEGTESSDDHINLKADAAGRVFAAVKHSTTVASAALTSLLVRGVDGTWSDHVFGRFADSHTRPIVLLDEARGLLHMFATGPRAPGGSGQSGGDIYRKTTPMDAVSFAAGLGSAVIRDDGSAELNNVTATKQNLSAASGLVVMAANATTNRYWHADVEPGTPEPAPTPPPSGPLSGADAPGVTAPGAFADEAGAPPASGAPDPTVDRVIVGLRIRRLRGGRVRLYGSVRPAFATRAILQRRSRRGRWLTVHSARLRATGSRAGAFAFVRRRARRATTYRVVVVPAAVGGRAEPSRALRVGPRH